MTALAKQWDYWKSLGIQSHYVILLSQSKARLQTLGLSYSEQQKLRKKHARLYRRALSYRQ